MRCSCCFLVINKCASLVLCHQMGAGILSLFFLLIPEMGRLSDTSNFLVTNWINYLPSLNF
jgi:hypothetical protein